MTPLQNQPPPAMLVLEYNTQSEEQRKDDISTWVREARLGEVATRGSMASLPATENRDILWLFHT